jgi:branched-subunit amino acid ABC-type transport system permease component
MAGGLLLPLQSVYPTIGNDVIQDAFIIVVAGGLGNFRGAAIVALLVGEFNSLGQLIPNMKPSVLTIALFCLVILLLMVRAQRQHSLVRL